MLRAQYSLPDYEHKMFETSRKQEEFNKNVVLSYSNDDLTSIKFSTERTLKRR